MNIFRTLLLTALIALPTYAAAQDAEAAPEENTEESSNDEIFAVIKKIDGDTDEIEIELPDGEEGTVAVGEKFPAGTTIATGEVTLILALEGTVGGKAINNAMISIRPITEMMIDTLLVDDSSAATRIKLKSGDIRVKITNDREDYSTDMKVATPNATASVTGTDVNRIGYSANFGTSVAVASGSIAARNSNGSTTNVGGGTALAAGSDSTLDSALDAATTNVAPIGMTSYEVNVSQLSLSGPARSGSDNNNPNTNPTSSRATGGHGGRVDDGQPLPSTTGRINRR